MPILRLPTAGCALLAVLCARLLGQSQPLADDKKLAQSFEQAARTAGEAAALYGRGVACMDSMKNDAEAAKWFRKAADKGHADAQHSLGYMYAQGKGVLKDDAEAVRWYRKAADQGSALAQCSLGFMYGEGRGVPKNDKESAGWYRKAAEKGLAEAQYNLGVMYANGRGVERDYASAAQWCRKAADQGDADAQFKLGNMYDNGRGVEMDDAEAVRWYGKAAIQGHAYAQHDLGIMHAKGEGVPTKDYAEACAWFILSASSVEAMPSSPEEDELKADIIKRRDAFEKLLTPQSRAQARLRAEHLRLMIEALKKSAAK